MDKRPNIVFVLTDDQGYGDLGCTGNDIINTPNIDNFHNESARLTNYHVGPTCAPTRAGLMTGHYANSTGVWHTVGGRSLLRKDEWSIASALRENGYKTGIFGKWHLGDEYPFRPFDRGFDVSIVHGGGGISQTPDYWGNDYFDDTYFVNGQPTRFEGYCTDVFFREGLKFIEDNKEKPFFCYIACNAPHGPYNVDNKYSDQYKGKVPDSRARFYGMISNIDENFGVLREKLKELNLEDNTILIFMTDNGSSGGSRLDKDGFLIEGYNAGLRGKKCSEYDGGHRVPFFIRWPNGDIAEGHDVNELTANVDFMPTMLDLCSVPVKDGVEFDGMSIRNLLSKSSNDNQERVIVTDSQRVAYPIKWRKSSVMTNKWRLINGKELYNILEDREQRNDISDKYPEVVDKLRKEYDKWWEKVSVKFDETIPIILNEKPTSFTNHDIRNDECETAWNQAFIRKGLLVNGYWEIEIEKEGTYKIELRRWPKSQNRPIASGIQGDDIVFSKEFIAKEDWNHYTGGEALDINKASINIQNIEQSCELNKNDTSASFEIKLKKGETKLYGWFSKDEEFCTSAYYVDVSFLD